MYIFIGQFKQCHSRTCRSCFMCCHILFSQTDRQQKDNKRRHGRFCPWHKIGGWKRKCLSAAWQILIMSHINAYLCVQVCLHKSVLAHSLNRDVPATCYQSYPSLRQSCSSDAARLAVILKDPIWSRLHSCLQTRSYLHFNTDWKKG